MTFATPWALLWLLAVPAVLVLHLFRRRLVERRVAASFLFPPERLVTTAGRTRTRLLRTPSLWLECLAAAVLALWLAGPSFGGAAARHVVFVLDDSASMGAGAAKKAVAAVTARAGSLASRDRVTILRTGPRPVTVLGPGDVPSAAAGALAAWHPVQPSHDPVPTLDLARELAAGGGEVVFCTDRAPAVPAPDVTVLAFGTPAANCAILTARRVLRAGGEDLLVRVGAVGAIGGNELTIDLGDGVAPAREAVVFEEGIADVTLRLPPGTGTVHLRLAGDALSIDDEAWLLPAPERVVAVCDLLAAESRAALQIARVFAATERVRFVGDPRDAQLVLTATPGMLRPGQLEMVIDAGPGERDAWRGPFVVDRSNGLFAGVHLQGVVWASGRGGLPGAVLVAAGKKALATEDAVDVGRRVRLDLDASVGNLVRSPDWPVLWTNVVEACRAEVPGVEEPNTLVGGEVRYLRTLVAGKGDREVVLEAPDGERIAGRGARTVGFVPARTGVHRVVGDGGVELARVGVRFLDPAESDLRGLASGEWPAAPPAAAADAATRDMDVERRVLALLLLLFVLLDWWVLDRARPAVAAAGGAR